VQPVAAIQSEYSLWTRDPEQNGVLETCEELGSASSPGDHCLTGKIDAHTQLDPKTDLRAEFPRFSSESITANAPVVDLLKQFAEKRKATPAQIALAWLLAQEPWIVPIPGTRREDHLNENLGAINIELTPADLREIESALSAVSVRGDRMSEKHMQQIDHS
jgi:aryl-alcohol dehydrogenase-like predicted oxidoreductase